ncbi:hypothetical protein U1Q18_052584 [Sarracenia purpurea var. burkii]
MESYCLYYQGNRAKFVVSPHVCPTIASPLQIHCRLGHPSLENLKLLVPYLHLIPTIGCESYLGKHHCFALASQVNNCELNSFMLVYSDVWGPIHVSLKLR